MLGAKTGRGRVMGDLTQARIGSVRRLLEQASDGAVQSLQGLLSNDGNSDRGITAIRELVDSEAADRRLRSAVFAPLAALFRPPGRIGRLCFPPRTPEVLWRALKRLAPEAVGHALDQARERGDRAEAAFDALCCEAALILRERPDGEVADLAQRLEDHSRTEALLTLLTLSPVLRRSLARLPEWLLNPAGEHDPAIRLAFKDAAATCEEGGVLLMEALFAHMDESPEILRLISVVMDRPTDRYLAASELAGFGQRLLDDIDSRIDVVRRFDPRRGLEAGVAVASAAEAAIAALTEFEQQVVLAREGVWGSRVGAQRRSLALAMEMRLREAEPAILAALPMQAVRQGGGRLKAAPGLASPPDAMAAERAFALLALLDGCRGSSCTGGFGAQRARVVENLDAWLEAYAEDLLELLRRGGGDAGRLRAYLDIAAEFTALVRGPEAGRIVRRRAAAA